MIPTYNTNLFFWEKEDNEFFQEASTLQLRDWPQVINLVSAKTGTVLRCEHSHDKYWMGALESRVYEPVSLQHDFTVLIIND